MRSETNLSNVVHPKLQFGVIGPHHGHVYAMIDGLIQTGRAECVSFFAETPELRQQMLKCVPSAHPADSEAELLENPHLQLICSAAPHVQKGDLAVRVMRAGKDFFVDKPGVTTLEQLAEVERMQKETGRLWFVWFGERLMDPTTTHALEVVRKGTLGNVVNLIGLGPHKLTLHRRPSWMFDPGQYGGILNDLAIHAIDMFVQLHGPDWKVVHSRVGNFATPSHPNFEDMGDMLLTAADGCTGYIRVDWLTPDSMPTYGDQRILVTGTQGTMELRKTVDLAVDNHRFTGHQLIVATRDQEPYRIPCSGKPPFYAELIQDVFDRVNRSVPHDTSFAATRIALEAQKNAVWISNTAAQ